MKKLMLNNLKERTFKEGFEEFIFNCKARGLREATIHHYKQSYAQIIRYMDKEMEIKITMFLSTGIRLSSLINIRVEDINFDDEVVNIVHTKNRNSLIIPLNRQIVSILKEYLRYRQYSSIEERLFCNCYGKELTKSSIIQAISTYNRSRGVKTTSIHKLRHTFAKKWVLGGNSVAVLQRILGHSSLQITQNYLNKIIWGGNLDVKT